jgi:hypothetical protein
VVRDANACRKAQEPVAAGSSSGRSVTNFGEQGNCVPLRGRGSRRCVATVSRETAGAFEVAWPGTLTHAQPGPDAGILRLPVEPEEEWRRRQAPITGLDGLPSGRRTTVLRADGKSAGRSGAALSAARLLCWTINGRPKSGRNGRRRSPRPLEEKAADDSMTAFEPVRSEAGLPPPISPTRATAPA